MDQLQSLFFALIVATSGGGVAWLGRTLNTYIAEKTKDHKFSQALSRLNDVVFTVVTAIQQTEVKAIKAAKDPGSPGGTKITNTEAKELASLALERVKLFVGADGVEAVMYVLGFNDSTMFDDYLVQKVESAVKANKTS